MVSPIQLPSTDETDEAGRTLVALRGDPDHESEWLAAVHVVDRWRRAHSEPLRTFQVNLRRKIRRRDIVATRLKRMPTIIGKLERLKRLRLSELQDIGGCRVVVSDTNRVFDVATSLLDSRILHRLTKRDNYIEAPRSTGYRGIHLVYEYRSNRRVTSMGSKWKSSFAPNSNTNGQPPLRPLGHSLGMTSNQAVATRTGCVSLH